MSSVMICVVGRDEVKSDFFLSTVSMMQYAALYPPDGLEGIGIEMTRTSILPQGRQTVASAAVKSGVTHTLWIDTDQAFPRDALHRLLAHDKDVVGCNIRGRRPPYQFVTEETPYKRLVTNKESTGLVPVHRLGFGLTLIRTEVFKAMEWPFFSFELLPDEKVFRGEDYFFCERARKAGFDFWVDHDLSKEVAHVGDFAFMP